MLAGAMIQATLLAGNSGGIALALDIEMGFTDRLLAAPISRFAIVLGRLAGTAALGALTAIWFLAIGLIFGARIEGESRGAADDRPPGTLSAVAFGGHRRRDRAAERQGVGRPGLFPLVFVILFLSTAFFPDDLLLEPAASIAEWNPLSFIVEGIRDPVISTLSRPTVARASRQRRSSALIGLGLSAAALRGG